MLKVGITGGIGSGKSMVTKIFEILGAPVLDADQFAKDLMNNNEAVKNQLMDTFGACIYNNNVLDRKRLSAMVFNNKALLEKLNNIVHPAVKKYGAAWMESQDAPYVLKEAALFFESGSNTDMDYIIGVSAPEHLRLQRAMARDGADEASIRSRMAHQMPEEEKMKLCDFIIYNDEAHSLIEQVLHLHQTFIKEK
jgi:dephospho-CoA kinase